MPIAKGQPWGRRAAVPAGAVVVQSDAEARELLETCRREKRSFPPLALHGGDLFRTLGGAGATGRHQRGDAVVFTVDLGEALLDGHMHLFVAHLIARSRLWGRAFVAMNAQWVGSWNLGPRAHPNDGLLDTYDVHLSLNQRLLVRSRVSQGAHLPHPGVVERRADAAVAPLARPLTVRLDGVPVGRASSIAVRCRPDALTVAVPG